MQMRDLLHRAIYLMPIPATRAQALWITEAYAAIAEYDDLPVEWAIKTDDGIDEHRPGGEDELRDTVRRWRLQGESAALVSRKKLPWKEV